MLACKTIVEPLAATIEDYIGAFREREDQSALSVAADLAAKMNSRANHCTGTHVFPFATIQLLGQDSEVVDEIELKQVTDNLRTYEKGSGLAKAVINKFVISPFEDVKSQWLEQHKMSLKCNIPNSSETNAASGSSPLLKLFLGSVPIRDASKDFESSMLLTHGVPAAWAHLGMVQDPLAKLAHAVPLHLLSENDWFATAEFQFTRDSYISIVKYMKRFNNCLSLAAWLQVTFVELGLQVTQIDTTNPGSNFRLVEERLAIGVELLQKELKELTDNGSVAIEFVNHGEPLFKDELERRELLASSHLNEMLARAVRLNSTWPGVFMDEMCGRLGQELATCTKKTQAMTPGWQFYITDTAYNSALAKSTLCVKANTVDFGQQVRIHCRLATSITDLCEMWGLPAPVEITSMSGNVELSNSVLEHAELTVAVIGAVSILEQAPKHEKSLLVGRFLEEQLPKNFPQYLLKLLKGLKSKHK